MYEITGKCLTAPSTFNRASLNKVHKENIQKAVYLIGKGDFDLQDFSGMTMAINTKKIAQAKEMMKTFRRAFSEFLNCPNEKDDSVYRLNIQFFPLYIKKK